MSAAEATEMGPIDYLLIEWRDQQPRGELKNQGILTEEEFAAQKAKILG